MSRRFILSAAIADENLNLPDWTLDKLQSLEQAGLDLLIMGAPDAVPFDAMVITAWAAPHTSTMGLVPCVTTGKGHPFHAARSLSSIDHLSAGRTGWCPLATDGDPVEKAADMASAARALWDGWSDNTLVIDKATGHYLNGETVIVPNYVGPFYKVRGPVNAARPKQGNPVLIVDDASAFSVADCDLALVSEAGSGPAAEKTLLKISGTPDMAELAKLFEAGTIDGVHIRGVSADELAAIVSTLAAEFTSARPAATAGATLRETLGLSLKPMIREVGDAA